MSLCSSGVLKSTRAKPTLRLLTRADFTQSWDGEAKLRHVSRECESDGNQDEGEEGAGQELEEHDQLQGSTGGPVVALEHERPGDGVARA